MKEHSILIRTEPVESSAGYVRMGVEGELCFLLQQLDEFGYTL